MRRAVRTGLCFVVAFSGLVQAGIVSSHGALKTSGNKIVDANGQPIQVAGMSMFWSGWMSKYWNKDVVGTLAKDWNSSVIRAAMGIEGGGNLLGPKDAKDTRTDAQIKEANKAMVRTVVDAAIANDIYVIVDWHDHNANKHLDESKAFFAEMSLQYKNTPNLIWEIWNEPENTNGTGTNGADTWAGDIKPYAEAVIAEIRKNSNNLIIVGTSTWSQDVDVAAASPVSDKNTAYTLHFYAGTHALAPNTDPKKGPSLGDRARTALSKGAALFITEWGTSDASGGGTNKTVYTNESDAWLKFAKDNGLSWANWSVADKDESSAALKPGSPTNGAWNDGNLTTSGLYVKAKIKEVTAAISSSTLGRGTRTALSARATSNGIEIALPDHATELVVTDLLGRVESRQILTTERNLLVPTSSTGVKLVQVRTTDGVATSTVAPLR